MQPEDRYLRELSLRFPNRYAAVTEIINLQAILSLPKGTEHFVSDVHGEYEAFVQIVNNCSGVIRDKIAALFNDLDEHQISALCTLIYYPRQVLSKRADDIDGDPNWYRQVLQRLISLAAFLSSKYTRSKVRKALPEEFRFVIDELMHAKEDEDHTRARYHRGILDSVIETGAACSFIEELCALIKRLAVDHLHVVGDIFDRGKAPDMVLDLLMSHHSMDIQWGNHDVLWMGAACGSAACCANVVRNNIRYDNYELLERGYGISMRKLDKLASKLYKDDGIRAIEKCMSDRLLLKYLNPASGTVFCDGRAWSLKWRDFPTLMSSDPDELTKDEQEVVDDLVESFTQSVRLKEHVRFLYEKGAMYKTVNGNVLYHGCVPFNPDGTFMRILCDGQYLQGRAYLDWCDQQARRAFSSGDQDCLDFMWYLWCGERSPLSGRCVKTFENSFIVEKEAKKEDRNPYYELYYSEEICKLILREFGLDAKSGHIINGHTPVRVSRGESAVRAGGRLLVIDGGFSKAYQGVTGIAGYTLIYNSHNLRLKAHRPFTSIRDAIANNTDILSDEILVETFKHRRSVGDIDDGAEIKQQIADLRSLIKAFELGKINERPAKQSRSL